MARLATDEALRPATWGLAATKVTALPQGRYCDVLPVPYGHRRAHQTSVGTAATMARSAAPASLAVLYDAIAATAARLGWTAQGFRDQPQEATFAVNFCRPAGVTGVTAGVGLSVVVGEPPPGSRTPVDDVRPLTLSLTVDFDHPDCRAAPPADLVGDPVPATGVTPAAAGRYMVAVDDGPTVVTSPVISDGRIYLADGPSDAGGSAAVYALDGGTGRQEWRTPVFGAVHAALAVADGTVYATTTVGTVIAIDAVTGRMRWTVPVAADQKLDGLGRTGTGVPVVIDTRHGTAYVTGAPVTSDSNVLYALDTATGRLRWRATVAAHPASLGPADSDGDGWPGRPVVTATLVIITGADGAVYAFDAATGIPRWRTGPAGAASVPAIHDGSVYVLTSHLNLIALDAVNGRLRWIAGYRPPHDAFAEKPFYSSIVPVAVAGAIVVNAGLPYAVRADTGKLLWATDPDPLGYPAPRGSGAATTAVPLLIDDENLLYGIDPTTGTVYEYARFDSQFRLGATAADATIAARLVLSGASPAPAPDTYLVVISSHA